jgi:hypothetical protein
VIDASVFLNNTNGVRVNGNISLKNLLIYQNSSAGIFLIDNYDGITILNCTLDRNSYGISTSSIMYKYFYVINSILTNNNYGIYKNSSNSNAYIRYSDIWNNNTQTYGSGISETNTLSTNPLFLDTPFDYSLSSGSPAIDAGENVPISTDLIGTVRPQNGDGINGLEYDMGAYEMPGTL